MERSKLIIIIPAFNEESSIAKVIENVLPYSDIIVVDDASSDHTAAIAKKAGAIVITHPKNLGYDGALNTGFEHAIALKKDFAITFDADGQHDPKLIEEFINYFDRGFELVLGVRPKKARFAETLMGFYFNWRFGISDILCGMKGYHLKWAILNKGFDHSNSIGSELALFAVLSKAKFTQIAVPIFERADQPRFGNLFQANIRILKALASKISLRR